MTEPTMLERLARKWRDEEDARHKMGNPGYASEDDARWWLRAVAEEAQAAIELDISFDANVPDEMASWLRSEADR